MATTVWTAPYIPFEFKVLMPHHLSQEDDQGGPYIREGKSYRRLWVHAISEGYKFRTWRYDVAWNQSESTLAYIKFYPGEEFAVTHNINNPSDVDITKSLFNRLDPDDDPSPAQRVLRC